MKGFFVFLLAFSLTIGIGLTDKESARISGRESLFYPTLSETSEGDIYMEFAGRSHKLSMRH